MKRLVYSPKAYVYIQTDDGMYNISDLVVSGNINRKVNQVSTAEVTFQNPDFTFTTPGNPTFRPMDKITIFLQRLPGFPVQSFTGYLDEAPYYQMYPGTISLRASCTLKRLQHTYFDPGLPFMIAFMSRYGWLVGEDGSIQSPQAIGGGDTADSAQSASMTDLMYACLKHIGGIDPGQILIEDLPDELIERVSSLYLSLHEANEESERNFNEWLKAYIGTDSAGDGGTTAATTSGITLEGLDAEQNNILDTLMTVADSKNAPEKYRLSAIATGLVESNLKNLKGGDADSQGWRQERMSIYGNHPYGPPTNVAAGARRYYEECKQLDHGQSAGELSADVQRPAAQYRGRYSERMGDAKALLNQYDRKKRNKSGDTADKQDGSDTTTKSGGGPEGTGQTTEKGGTQGGTTRYDAIVAEANRLSKLAAAGLKYNNARPPSDTNGNDCSSGQCLLLKAAGYKIAGWPATNTIKQYMKRGKDPTGRITWWNSDKNNTAGNSVHIWAEINGRPFTTGNHLGNHWDDGYYAKNDPAGNGFEPFHVGKLDEPADVPADADTSDGEAGEGSDSGSGFNDALAAARAGSVNTVLNFPQAVDSAESLLLRGSDARGKALMNDQPLLPFIEQLSNGSLRNFMSLPNGDFYAFHPDYFGAMGTSPYWEIDDIEVLEGGIQLTDDALSTHVFVVGATLPDQQFDIVQKVNTHGVVNILNAGQADFLNLDPAEVAATEQKNKIDETDGRKKKGAKEIELRPFLGSEEAALNFLQRYGARPLVEEAPFIRSHIFETFYAYQKFMLSWARQFQTSFSFTFMPEIYPGGLVGFKDHGINMYVDEVTHSWDYQNGFTTQANLTAPSSRDDDRLGISRGMVRSYINRKDK